ncbi:MULTISPECIES: serine acetyltransferase [unclassified Cellulophaga]|uniref:serine acetyltransferase n=1 Tax=unclassified Cellulophaga TaxID=2634405 RepID=UPI001C4F4F50|nr:serine acetyltransferase [Cellulophaga sp. HaHa_2_1]QXP52447.1 serine acetyltransferase [Cellulophaga sp. HaHa_2_1]
MNGIIKKDLFRYAGETSMLKGFRKEGFRYTFLFRKASKYKKKSILGIFYRLLIKKYNYKYGYQIPVNTEIGEGLYLGHFGPVVINSKAKIGKNCNIAHNTTIGQSNRGRLKGYPTLGNKVWIGTGSVIVGKVFIGNNVLIAPNSYVNMDVPDNSIVMGNPSNIISKENATEGYINYTS